jgi:fido (protein-threonine AMPylation protein)
MFSRLFDWSGQVRDVDTVAGTTGILYARPAFIETGLAEMFTLLARDESLLSTDDPSDFAYRLSRHWGYLLLVQGTYQPEN